MFLLLLHFSRSRSWLYVNPTIWNLSSVSALRKVPFLVKSLYSSSPIQDIYSTLKIRSIPFSSANLLKFVSQLQEFLFLSHFFLSSQPFPFLGRKERKKEEIKRKKEETNSHFFFLDLSDFVLHFFSLILPFSFTFFLLSKKAIPISSRFFKIWSSFFFFSFLTPWEKYKRSSLFDPGGPFFSLRFPFLSLFFLSFFPQKEEKREDEKRKWKNFEAIHLLSSSSNLFFSTFSHFLFHTPFSIDKVNLQQRDFVQKFTCLTLAILSFFFFPFLSSSTKFAFVILRPKNASFHTSKNNRRMYFFFSLSSMFPN